MRYDPIPAYDPMPAFDEGEVSEDSSVVASVPQTGDPMLLYAVITTLSGVGLMGLFLGRKKQK